PSGVNESCQEFIAPHDASVVTVAKSAELAIPNLTSLPSIFPPACITLAVWSTPVNIGLPFASAQYATVTPTRKSVAIAAQTAHPCLCEPVIRPSVYVNPAEIAKIEINAIRLVSGVGFSNG